MASKKGNKDEHKDKFDENVSEEGMDTIDNENSSEEKGLNRGEKERRQEIW